MDFEEMNCEEMRAGYTLELVSLNLAGYAWKLSAEPWRERLQRACHYIKSKTKDDPFIVALQEVQLGGGKYLDVLREEFPQYEIILPEAYQQQPKSVVAVLLLNKKICTSHSVMTLDKLADSLRYNLVTVTAVIEGDELCFRILNVHLPHLLNDNRPLWYQKSREDLQGKFVSAISAAAETYRKEPDVKFLMLGDMNLKPAAELIQRLVYLPTSPMLDACRKEDRERETWMNPVIGGKGRLDYIFYSNGMLLNTGIGVKRTVADMGTVSQQVSDHALLIGGIVAAI